MKTNQNKLSPTASGIGLIIGQFHHYAHAMDLDRFTETEKQFIGLYYLNLKELLDRYRSAHRLFQFYF